MYMW